MKAREFDPVLSAALRNELESLPGAADARPVAVLRRPQVWITAITALALVAATVGVLRLTATRAPEPARDLQVVDPLSRITDPRDAEYLPNGVWSLLHLSGTGPATYELDVPEGTTSVRPLLACAPSADFRITVGRAYWTHCDRQGAAGYADIPVSPGRRPIAVHVPAGVRWRLAVIETPEEGTTYSTLRVTGAPATPAPPVTRFPAPAREEDVPVGVASGGSGTSTGALVAPVDELALVTACRGTGGLVITMSNGLRFGTDDAPIPCGADAGWTGAANDDTAQGYRSAGRMTYRVRAIGDVAWRATFSSRTEERLPYPAVTGTVLARTRGSDVDAYGSLGRPVGALKVVVTCRGTGGLTISAQESGAAFSDAAGGLCGRGAAKRTETSVSKPGGLERYGAQHYEIRPTGSILWTVTFLAD